MNETAYRQAEDRFWRAFGLQRNEKHIELAGTGTSVRVQICGDGPPVLFIHGGPNAGSGWVPVLGAFDGFTRLVVDRPGTGLSEPWPAIVGTDNLLGFADRFVDDVLSALEVERADVVASSLGGFLALRSAAVTPHRFGRMVQMACPAFVPGMELPMFMRMLSFKWLRKVTSIFPPNPRVGDAILRQIGHGASLDAGRISPSVGEWYLELQRHTDTMKNEGDLIGSLRGNLDRLTLSDELMASIDTPTLYLWGEDDTFGGRDVAEHVTGVMPNAELEMFAGSGHLPWIDFPAEIGARARAFLV